MVVPNSQLLALVLCCAVLCPALLVPSWGSVCTTCWSPSARPPRLHLIFAPRHPPPAPTPCCPAAEEMKANFEAGHVCWDDHDVIGGRPTGVVRASFGYASTLADSQAIGERH